MRAFRWLLAGVLVVFAPVMVKGGAPNMPPPLATLRGIGGLAPSDFPSAVRDATRVGTTIHAVGNAGPNAVLWTLEDGGLVTKSALPDFMPPPGGAQASAITPDATHVATQARNGAASTAARVTRDPLTGNVTELLNLNFSAIAGPSVARGSSDDGLILYGLATTGARAARFDVTGGTSALIPQLAGTTNNAPAFRAVSSDGSVMVGSSFSAPYSGTTGGHAFRYVHGAAVPVSAIPELSGGTWSKGLAVSPNGNLVLSAGNSVSVANGEMYLYDVAANVTTPLGSPNSAWIPQTTGGMTADGSVVMVTYAPTNNQSRYAYFRNSHGWFHLEAALLAAGVDPSLNWARLSVNGFSSDGTLVYGFGRNSDENQEGFVAEFPAGFLANFDVHPVVPTNTSIVGAWFFDPETNPNIANPMVLALLADGTYFEIEADVPSGDPRVANGFERGRYTWNAATGAFHIASVQDTNGDTGFSDPELITGNTVMIAGDTITFTVSPTVCQPASACSLTGTRIIGGAGSIVGAWFDGNAAVEDNSVLLILLGDGTYYMLQDGDSNEDASGHDGVERGTYSWNSLSGAFSVTTIVDTNGEWGPQGWATASMSADDLLLSKTEGGQVNCCFYRVVDPAAIRPAITSQLSASGTVGTAFTYAVTTSYPALTIDAAGLPSGLTMNTGTGVISGTPSVSGPFDVTLTASNSLSTATAVLHLTIGPQLPTLTGLATANIWIGLKNGDDAGTKFDLRVELLKNGAVVTSAELGAVPGGSSGFNNAALRAITASIASATSFNPGDVLGVRLSVRIAASSSHRSGTARLWFNDGVANSRVDTVTSGLPRLNYLINGFTLGSAPGVGPKSTVDVLVDRNVGGNPFKAFGTWTITF